MFCRRLGRRRYNCRYNTYRAPIAKPATLPLCSYYIAPYHQHHTTISPPPITKCICEHREYDAEIGSMCRLRAICFPIRHIFNICILYMFVYICLFMCMVAAFSKAYSYVYGSCLQHSHTHTHNETQNSTRKYSTVL